MRLHLFFILLAACGAAAVETGVIADFESDNGGFYSVLAERDPTQAKVGKASCKITFQNGKFWATRENLLDLKLHRAFTALRFWAKSDDLDQFEVHFLDARGQAHQLAVGAPQFAADGQWHQIVIDDLASQGKTTKRPGGPDDGKWYWPATELTFTKAETHEDRGEYHLWLDQIEVDLGAQAPPSPLSQAPQATRLLGRPLWDRSGEEKRQNAYFCSLIRIPDWIPPAQRADPSARYYLYWAVHKGNRFIHMCWAKDLMGPYTEFRPQEGGVLRNVQVGIEESDSDFASPDVHVLDDARKIRMYMHSHATTYVAESADGLAFTGVKDAKGFIENPGYYYRVWPWKGAWYALSRGNVLGRSEDGLHFTKVAEVFPNYRPSKRHVFPFPNPQHPEILDVFLCRVYAQDEHIELARFDVSDPDPARWHQVTGYLDVLRPEKPYEGSDLPPGISIASSEQNQRQLRDPFIYVEAGKIYMLYTVKAELGFAIAELKYP